MESIYRQARAQVRWWDHVHGGRADRMQLLGELWDGHLGWRRRMPWAWNTALDVSHRDLVDVEVWNRGATLCRFLR